MQSSTNYDDGLIACQDVELVIRRYYFPFGLAKHVRYDRTADGLRVINEVE